MEGQLLIDMVNILVFLILILFSGFFSGSETAFFSLSVADVRKMLKKNKFGAAYVYRLKKKPENLLATILIGNNIVNIATASYATIVSANYFGSAAMGIATGITTIFVLVFGEIIPKTLAYGKKEFVAGQAAPLIYFLSLCFYPLIVVLEALNVFLRHKLGVINNEAITEEEVRTMARLGVEHGGIDYREHEMIENIFRFDDVVSGDAMTPLYKVTLINGDVPVDQIAHFIANEEFSRYPVYEDDEDNIIGYIHIKDVLKA
ncbi:DUF21 domain-containing protein, partial [Candidatus Parcubacteria bacterium]